MSASTFFRSAGVLLHPTSLPGRHGIGDFGAGARAFVDWLAAAGVARWQVLPLVPPGPSGSPYSSPSAFALNTALIDLDALVQQGLLSAHDTAGDGDFDVDRVDFARVHAYKFARIDRAAQQLLSTADGKRDVDAFAAAHAWAFEFARFVAFKNHAHQQPWWLWGDALAAREPAALKHHTDALRPEISRVLAAQLLVQRQYDAVRDYARDRGVSVIGDLPIYVDLDSVDVWMHRDMFLLDASGTPLGVSGVPPDAFSATGQLWGNPLYDVKAMKADGHQWWIARMQRALTLSDIVRIDHFRAFSAYWAVPYGAPDARGGAWVRGLGRALFDDLRAALGALPIIAEDLGVITPDVVALRDAVGLPGMKVLQFAWDQGPHAAYLPHNHVDNCVVYTGTHDNDTTLGFWRTSTDDVRDQVRRYYGISGDNVVWDFIRSAMASVAHTAVVPMQDVLALDSGARMNTPAICDGNWAWRVRREAFHDSLSTRLGDLVALYGRAANQARS